MRPAVPADEEDRLLVRHILDIAKRSEQSYRPLYSTFLDDRQLAICEAALKSEWGDRFDSFGGYPSAERKILAFGDGDSLLSCIPFSAAVFNYRVGSNLCHRDFLGSLMALGVKRELFGDILVGKTRTAVFVMNTALGPVKEMTRVGKCGVWVTEDFSDADIPVQEFEEIKTTVASLRLDSVVSDGLRISREKAAELIRTKGVLHNRVMTYSPDDRVEEGDRISARGFGKFELYEVGTQSKKGRIFITLHKFI